MSALFYNTDLTDAGLDLGRTGSAGDAARRASAHHRPSWRRQCHLLSAADRLPMAPAAKGISTLGYGLPLFPDLAEQWCLGSSTPHALRAGSSRCWTGSLSFGGDYGWPIGQDDR